MGIWSKVKNRFERRGYSPLSLLGTYVTGGIFGGGPSDSGIKVTEASAMRLAAVWACVRTISETIAGLPFHVYQDKDGVKTRDRSHPINDLIYRVPNEYMTSFTLRDALLTNLLLYGNGYAVIERDPYTGYPTALLPVPSQEMTVRRERGQLLYITGSGDILTADRVIHLLGVTYNAIVGLSPIQQQMNALGLAVAVEQFGSKFFANGASLNGVFERTGNISPEAAKAFKDEWQKFYCGVGASHGTPMLPMGVQYKSITIPPESAQFLETRKYQRADVAAIFRCMPYVVGDHEHSTFSNLEAQGRLVVMHTLAPWIIRVEQEFTRKLFRQDEQGRYSVKLNVDGIQRGDLAARQAFYANGRQWGYLSADDIRQLEDLPPLPDGAGATYLQPVNMQPAGSPPSGGGPTPDPKPTPEPEQKPDTTAARSLIEDAARRLLAKEGKAVQRAAKKHAANPEAFRSWATDFYRRHSDLVARTVSVPFRAAGVTVPETDYASRHCEESRTAIVAAFEAGTVDDVLDDFETIRPHDIARRLFEKEKVQQ